MKNGFSLIEVLIFVSVLALFFVVAVAVTTATLRNMQVNEHKIIATHYAEELSNWLTSQKEEDWNTFVNYASSTPYCFKSLNWPASPAACSATDQIAGTIYTRQATVDGDTTQMKASITVSWSEGGNKYSVPINTVYQLWE